MTECKLASRDEIFNVPDENGDEVYLPDLDLEFIEVSNAESENQGQDANDNEEQEEFDFPLFSFGAMTDATYDENIDVPTKTTGTSSSTKLMKISLNNSGPEEVIQKRPQEYYFSKYTEDDHRNFARSAVDYQSLVQDGIQLVDSTWSRFRGKVIDLDKHNAEVDLQQLRELKKKRRRPGKKQRDARKVGTQQLQKREELVKELKKQLKKKFHKRGGKKNKKKETIDPTTAKNTSVNKNSRSK